MGHPSHDVSPQVLDAVRQTEIRLGFLGDLLDVAARGKVGPDDFGVPLLGGTKLEQLFDLKADPREENDLAADPAQADRLKEMRERFNELKAAAK